MPTSAKHICPCSQEGLESGEPGTDDGRFYFHLGDALQRVGDNSVSETPSHTSEITVAIPEIIPEIPDIRHKILRLHPKHETLQVPYLNLH